MPNFSALDTSSSGLTAQRLRMDTIAQNIANVNTTRGENGKPYKRKVVLFEEKSFDSTLNSYINKYDSGSGVSIGNGVRVAKIVEDKTPYKKVYDPGNPDADEDGYVEMPNVDVVTEMINMISATRSYEANVTALNATKDMLMKALEIGR